MVMVNIFLSVFLPPPEELEASQSSNYEETDLRTLCVCVFIYAVFWSHGAVSLIHHINMQTVKRRQSVNSNVAELSKTKL